jgi:DNA polymerase I-like protein with 3'-5' exonuclease and polymerase domains
LTAKLTGLERKYAKAVFLALCYGEGGAKLCRHQLKIPTRWRVTFADSQPVYFETEAEAVQFRKQRKGRARILEVAGVQGQEILDTFNARMPFVRELSDIASRKAEESGCLTILGGRVLHFPLARDGGYDYCYKALNRAIQGSSGYQCKIAMLQIAKEMPDTWIQLQRHDDLAGSFSSRKEAKEVARIMTTCVKARLPFRADVEVGTSDGDIHQLCAKTDCYEHAVKDDIGKYWCGKHQAL